MKLDLDTVPTVPDDPPAAGPDRALDPPPALPVAPAEWLLDAGCVADAEGDEARPTESPITGLITAAAKSNRPFRFDSNRRTRRSRACLATVTADDQSGEDTGEGAAAPASPEPAASDGSDVAMDMGREGEAVSSVLVGS